MDKSSSSLVVLLLILTSLSLPASTRPYHSRHKRHACESVLQCASAVGASIPIRQETFTVRIFFQKNRQSSLAAGTERTFCPSSTVCSDRSWRMRRWRRRKHC